MFKIHQILYIVLSSVISIRRSSLENRIACKYKIHERRNLIVPTLTLEKKVIYTVNPCTTGSC